eukprot:CAMPEP_0198737594 /NCGR_PEP_ID=MMETSP1475-20131203/67940_1 /TAXON_ID= ORGANISM="Unidentified sp., Strain CCMP1999" /NCGR_SAMPLE_ID=MMETSP1475 /ASSEMBLY_ACC=CAM_ASM_001111 /LENGTH=579 /DNA_ID=CAMNT_0044501463 /DNA_START=406 /DNA_END=2145 /DNA_ORIENTATION=+
MRHPFEQANTTTVVQLHIEAHKLRDMDGPFKSDPFAVVYKRGNKREKWMELGRTETVKNCRDPKFVRSFDLPYVFEMLTEVRVEMFDRDSESEELTKHDYMGSITTTLAQVVTSPGRAVTLELRNENSMRKRFGFLTLLAEEIPLGKRTVYMDLGVRFERKDNKLYKYRILRSREDGSWTPVYQSETARPFNNVIRFKSCVMKGSELNGGDDSRPLRVEVQKEKGRGQFLTIANTNTSLATLLELPAEGELDLLSFEKRGESGGGGNIFSMCLPTGAKQAMRIGNLIAYKLNVVKEATFLDYLAGGCRLSMSIAVDFTSSNGDPRLPGTNHFVDINNPNCYEVAMRLACNVVENYVSEQKYHAWGFGARLPPLWQVSHCFPLGSPTDSACVNGVGGLLDAYRRSVTTVQLYGPTIFSDVLDAAAGPMRTEVSQDRQTYSILFILTDGVIADMAQTIEQLVNASHLPLSVVIVGIGNEDFSKMRVLDADDKRLIANGKEAARDIVQFVSFDAFRDNMDSLAREMLAEIPNQVVEYFTLRNIKPNPPSKKKAWAPPINGSFEDTPHGNGASYDVRGGRKRS